jgi:hypothetical protein
VRAVGGRGRRKSFGGLLSEIARGQEPGGGGGSGAAEKTWLRDGRKEATANSGGGRRSGAWEKLPCQQPKPSRLESGTHPKQAGITDGVAGSCVVSGTDVAWAEMLARRDYSI